MRICTLAIGAILSVLLAGTSAQAGLLTSATWVGENFGEFDPSFGITSFPGTSFTLVTSGASLTASGSAAGSAINTVSLTVAAPAVGLSDGTFLSQTLGGSQTLAGNVANQGVSGALRIYIGLNSSSGTLLYHVPLSAGVGGNFTATSVIPNLNIPVEVAATYFPWTTGSHTLAGLTQSGVPLPNFTVAGTNSLVDGAGSITLVSPTADASLPGADLRHLPVRPRCSPQPTEL